MVGRYDEHKFEAAHRLDRQQSFWRRIARRTDDQVGPSARQRIPATAQHFHGQADARSGCFPIKILQQREQALGRDEIVDRDAQFGLPTGRNVLDAVLEVGRGAQQMAALTQQRFTGIGQACAMAAAVEQLDAEILLELLDRVGNGRGNTMQFLPRGGEAAVTGDGIQNQQCIQRNSHGGCR